MKLYGSIALALHVLLALAEQSPLLVPSDFIPSIATMTRLADPTAVDPSQMLPSDQPVQALSSIILSGKSISQCGPSVTCHPKPISSVVTVYDSTSTQIENTTRIESQYYTNTVVDLLVSVISSTIAHEGICTEDVTVRMPLLVITVGRNVTSTNFYLTESTTTRTTTTVVGVTSSHACTKSMPPNILPVAPLPQPVRDAVPHDIDPGSSGEGGRPRQIPVPAAETLVTEDEEDEEGGFLDAFSGFLGLDDL